MISKTNSPRDTQTNGTEYERYYVSKLRGKLRLYRKYKDDDGIWHNQVLPVTNDDLTTAEGAERAKDRWRRNLIEYPCAYCGKPIEMTWDEFIFFTQHMLTRYSIGALPTCSKECAEALAEKYHKSLSKVIDQTAPRKR